MIKKVIVKENEAGERLDIFLAKSFSGYSRSYFSKMVKEELIKVNNSPAKTSYPIGSGDEIWINFVEDEKKKVLPEKIALDIIYEDKDVIVLNKQPGIVVHPAAGNITGTLVSALLYYFPKIKEAVYEKGNEVSEQRPGLVHRLDRNTSGVMIVAKNARSMHSLSKQIQNRTIKKVYWALCSGWPKNASGELINYLGRHPKNRKLIADIGEKKGKEAISYYKVLRYLEDRDKNKISLIEFDIKTGRTHQIRVQSAIIGNPVIGDDSYGNKQSMKLSEKLGAARQLLYAKSLSITLPGDTKQSVFNAPIPRDLDGLLNVLKNIHNT